VFWIGLRQTSEARAGEVKFEAGASRSRYPSAERYCYCPIVNELPAMEVFAMVEEVGVPGAVEELDTCCSCCRLTKSTCLFK
jgi:hypothetical protein